MLKKKIISLECVNCIQELSSENSFSCGRCKITKYCSKPCQKQHWKDHKRFCIKPEDRTVQKCQTTTTSSIFSIMNECLFCFEDISNLPRCNINCTRHTISKLGCGHEFHTRCLVEYKKNYEYCPICKLDMKLNLNSIVNKIKELHLKQQKEYMKDNIIQLDILFTQLTEFTNRNVKYALASAGAFYMEGIGVNIDYKQAIKYLFAASAMNDHDSICNLGMIYEYGYGTEQNIMKAFEYYTRAAELNNSTAQYKLGGLYFNGFCVEKDEKKGYEYLMLSVEQSYSYGQFKLGQLYEYGIYLSKDKKLAIKYYKLAAKQGLKEAIDKLDKLDKS